MAYIFVALLCEKDDDIKVIPSIIYHAIKDSPRMDISLLFLHISSSPEPEMTETDERYRQNDDIIFHAKQSKGVCPCF